MIATGLLTLAGACADGGGVGSGSITSMGNGGPDGSGGVATDSDGPTDPAAGRDYGGTDAPVNGGSSGDTGGAERTCAALPEGAQPPLLPVYRVPLRVHRRRSDLGDDQLCAILEEINEIWWKQAAICFEIEAVKSDPPAATGLDFFFERESPFPNGVTANGVFTGAHEIYGLDHPKLAAVKTPARDPAARTAAHELGHALSLQHQNPDQEMNCLFRGTECDELLMRSGHRGFQIAAGSPANVNEQIRARTRAALLSLPSSTAIMCSPPRLLPN